MKTTDRATESGPRFQFGRNWRSFLSKLDPRRIEVARQSLCEMLECADLEGQRFLDIGSGSGLFSLAARTLGAAVHSFDFDADSVACTERLRAQFYADDPRWVVERGSVLDVPYLESLGRFDVVYAWGVLHHTGDLWQALRNAAVPLDAGGKLFISIYNDRGVPTRFWRGVKRFYCSGPVAKWAVLGTFLPWFAVSQFAKDVARVRSPRQTYVRYKEHRGMSLVHDWIDWLGGYPFEAATAGEVLDLYDRLGLRLCRLKRCSGNGTNQFVFRRDG